MISYPTMTASPPPLSPNTQPVTTTDLSPASPHSITHPSTRTRVLRVLLPHHPKHQIRSSSISNRSTTKRSLWRSTHRSHPHILLAWTYYGRSLSPNHLRDLIIIIHLSLFINMVLDLTNLPDLIYWLDSPLIYITCTLSFCCHFAVPIAVHNF